MSPLDDELRRVLSARSLEAPLEIDPLAGIEREAKHMRRRRTAMAVAGTVLSLAAVAVAIPAVRAGLPGSDKKVPIAQSPTATPAANPLVNSPAPPNAFAWHRDVPAADLKAVAAEWTKLHDGSDPAGQGLWSAPAEGIPGGRVVVAQLWTGADDLPSDAWTVAAVVGGPEEPVVILSDDISFFLEQQPGESSSVTKYDMDRTTHLLFAYRDSSQAAHVILVTPPRISEALVDGEAVDIGSGGAIAARERRSVSLKLTDDRGSIAYDDTADPTTADGLVSAPTRWHVPSASESGADNGELPAVREVDAEAALEHAHPEVAGARVVAEFIVTDTFDGRGKASGGTALVLAGEVSSHGWSASDSAFVVAVWLQPVHGDGQLVGVHDVPLGERLLSFRVPAGVLRDYDTVLSTLFTQGQVEYRPAGSDVYTPEIGGRPGVSLWRVRPGSQQELVAHFDSGVTVTQMVGQGLTFPDI